MKTLQAKKENYLMLSLTLFNCVKHEHDMPLTFVVEEYLKQFQLFKYLEMAYVNIYVMRCPKHCICYLESI